MDKKTWFSADLHISHSNILDFSPERIDALGMKVDKVKLAKAYTDYRADRKNHTAKNFIMDTVDEMNEAIVTKWNSDIGFSDDVFIIGDVSFAKDDVTKKFLNRMNGRLHLIRGNHDKYTDRLDRWEFVKDYYEGYFDTIKVVMFHFPIQEWNKCHHGAFHLHGHVHGKPTGIEGRILDVAMESVKSVAIEWNDVRDALMKKPVRAHHDKYDT